MGAAWRNPKDRDMPAIVEMVKGVRAMGLETCMTLGMLTPTSRPSKLAEAGLDYYNHNIDSSPEYYERDHHHAHLAGPARHARPTCARRGSTSAAAASSAWARAREDRVGFIHTLATLPAHPESVPVNALVPVKGTVLGDMLARHAAGQDRRHRVRPHRRGRAHHDAARMVRLSAGRESMSEATQALCFLAGANSIFTGDKLLTAGNAGDDADAALFAKLGLRPMTRRRAGAGGGGVKRCATLLG